MKERGFGLERLHMEDNQKGSSARRQNLLKKENCYNQGTGKLLQKQILWINELTKHASLLLFYFFLFGV